MERINLKTIDLIAVLIAAVLLINVLLANAQEPAKAPVSATTQATPAVALTAKLVDAEQNAKQKSAIVEVSVTGVLMTDPAMAGGRPMPGQAHLHYRVDNGPVIATTATKLSFHELTPGQHKITIALAANDHSPLGPEQTLTITVP